MLDFQVLQSRLGLLVPNYSAPSSHEYLLLVSTNPQPHLGPLQACRQRASVESGCCGQDQTRADSVTTFAFAPVSSSAALYLECACCGSCQFSLPLLPPRSHRPAHFSTQPTTTTSLPRVGHQACQQPTSVPCQLANDQNCCCPPCHLLPPCPLLFQGLTHAGTLGAWISYLSGPLLDKEVQLPASPTSPTFRNNARRFPGDTQARQPRSCLVRPGLHLCFFYQHKLCKRRQHNYPKPRRHT